jgi:uncharacterized protein YuzE
MQIRLTIEADVENDCLYIAFSSRTLGAGSVKRTVRVNDDLAPDYDGRGALIGPDVMHASNTVPALMPGKEVT